MRSRKIASLVISLNETFCVVFKHCETWWTLKWYCGLDSILQKGSHLIDLNNSQEITYKEASLRSHNKKESSTRDDTFHVKDRRDRDQKDKFSRGRICSKPLILVSRGRKSLICRSFYEFATLENNRRSRLLDPRSGTLTGYLIPDFFLFSRLAKDPIKKSGDFVSCLYQ